jgi:hypothetical protein
VVPPARYRASGSALTSATAAPTSSARTYSKGRIATRSLGRRLLGSRRRCWDTHRSGRCCRS